MSSHFFLHSGGPTVPIKSRLPPSGTRTPPRVARTENKSDDKLFEFLNSNIPATKERKVIKPKVSVESSSDVVSNPVSNMEQTRVDSIDGKLNEGELVHLLLCDALKCPFIRHLELKPVEILCCNFSRIVKFLVVYHMKRNIHFLS